MEAIEKIFDRNVEIGKLKVDTPIEVLFEGADISKYLNKASTNFDLSNVSESFCFLFVGHWLQGEYGEDRKNIGYTVKTFLETFKNKTSPPALILKTSHATASLMDRTSLERKIEAIRATVKGKLPSIYVIHGDMTDEEVNWLYNHSKVKVMVSHTRGEGFGRPLLEFSLVGKPIIASGWSGHLDFLDKDLCTLINGTIDQLHPSSVQKNVLLKESGWFKPDDAGTGKAWKDTFKHYKKYATAAKKLRFKNKNEFNFDSMVSKLQEIFTKHIPEIAQQVQLALPKINLPKLKKVSTPPVIKLPKLKKI